MKCPEAGFRLFFPILFAGVLMTDSYVQADEGIPALLQFAEEYHSKMPDRHQVPPVQPVTTSPPPAVPSQPSPRPVVRDTRSDSEHNALKGRLKILQSRLTKQQDTITLLEGKLRSLHQTVQAQKQALEQARQELNTAPTVSENSTDAFERVVNTLRKAFTGKPDEKELHRLLTDSRKNEERISRQLSESQALAAALQTQLHEHQNSFGRAEREIRLKDESGNEMQIIIDELRQELAEEQRSLNDVKAAYSKLQEHARTLATAFNALKAIHEKNKLENEQRNDEILALKEAPQPLKALVEGHDEDTYQKVQLLEKQIQILKKENTELALLKETSRALDNELAAVKEKEKAAVSDKMSLEQQLQTLKKENTELALLKETSRDLNNELAAVKEKEKAAVSDKMSLEQQLQTLKKENTELALLKETSRDLNNELAAVKEKEKAAVSDKMSLEQQLQTLKKENTELAFLKETSRDLNNELAAVKEKEKAAVSAKKLLEQQLQTFKKEKSEIRMHPKKSLTLEELKKNPVRRNYAEGSMLGRDIASLLKERTDWGIKVDRDIILAGIIDTIQGNFRLSQDEYRAALSESERLVISARDKVRKTQQSAGEAFIREFKSRKGAKQSSSGFWYYVDYEGDTPVPADATVDVVVKESLTDGLVIQDMDLSGQVLSQPLSNYPPLFREAIGYLKNHGSITLVVPPTLAYGDAGYPPMIPPNATMVYVLRIENVTPASASTTR